MIDVSTFEDRRSVCQPSEIGVDLRKSMIDVSIIFFIFIFFYSKNILNSPWANAKSKVHAQQFGNLRRTAQVRGGKQEYKVLE